MSSIIETSTTSALPLPISHSIVISSLLLLLVAKFLNSQFSVTKTNRTWYPHLPIFFDQIILDDMFAAFSPEFDLTARHRLRAKNDMQIEFTYYNFIIESRAQLTALNTRLTSSLNQTFANFFTSSIPDAYKYERVDPDEDISYITYGKFPDRNMRALNRFRKNPKKFLCINDVMDHSDKSGAGCLKTVVFTENFR